MMPAELTFFTALLVGLLGSSHCIGMCGGIASALNFSASSGPTGESGARFLLQLAYNLGRLGSYMVVGLAAGTLGAQLTGLGVSPLVGKLIAAGFMIALGLYLANWWRGLAQLERLGAKLWRRLQPLGENLFPPRSPWQAFLLGTLWGWLPCGLVYAAVAWSLTAGNAIDGALLMLGFGLGTLPAMLLVGSLAQNFRQWVRAPLIRALAGSGLILFGVYGAVSGFAVNGQVHHQADSAAVLVHPERASIRAPANAASAAASSISTSRRFTSRTPDS